MIRLDFAWQDIRELPDLKDQKDEDQKDVTLCLTGCEKLTSLKGAPDTVLSIRAKGTKSLKSLIDGPKRVLNAAYFQDSGLESLEGLMEVGRSLYVCDCPRLTSLHGIGTKYLKSCSSLYLSNTIKENILGLMLIKNLDVVTVFEAHAGVNKKLDRALEIINKHREYKIEPNIIDCQHELIEAGLEEFAEL